VGDQPDAVAAVLEAGADDCLRATNPRELAARLIALSRRRLMTSKGDPPLRLSFGVIDPGA
jgi:DNA-binding response OmpR family regulator